MEIECNFKLREKEFQDLMEIYLRRIYSHTRIEIFREIDVSGSSADFVVFSPYQNGIIHIYELKMYWDKDHKRLKRQVKDYLKVADYLTIAVFGSIPKIKLPAEANIMNVKVRNGWLDYEYVGEGDFRKRNDDYIDINRRLNFMKRLRNLWRSKQFYADKIIGIIQRRLIRQEKKLQKSIKSGNKK